MDYRRKTRENSNVRSLHIIWEGAIGGAQSFLCSLLEELSKYEGLDIEVCSAKQGGPIGEKMKELGIPVHCLNMVNGFDLLHGLKLVKLIRQNKYDIVHSHSPQPLVRLMMALAKRKGSFLTEHGSILDDISGRHKPEIYYHRFLARFIHFYIAVSDSVKKGLINRHHICSKKIKVIPTGLNLRNFQPIDTEKLKQHFKLSVDTPVIGAIGRLSPEKGIDHLILASRHIVDKFPDCMILIVGDGGLREKLENQASDLGISRNVRFVGEQTQIADFISLMDIVVMPSVHEGLPLVALESMAMGKPIVGYNVRGISDIIVNNQNGLLVDKRDPLLLADKVIGLLEDKVLRSKLGETGRRQILRNFDIAVVAQQYIELYSLYLKRFIEKKKESQHFERVYYEDNAS